MKFGDNWFQETIEPELQEVCDNRISSYYRWRLNTINERFAHIFFCELYDQDELAIYWKRVVNNISVYVQSELDNLLERSNFYIWFWLNKDIDENLKREIENDKYSAKKFVITNDKAVSEEEKLALVESHIFKFKFSPEIAHTKMIQKVELENFRAFKGHKTFSFCREKGDIARLVVLFAPNGRGKTSFLDGIEWNLTGTISRFALMGNKKVKGKILKSTEAQVDEKAYVKITMDDGGWLKRTVINYKNNSNKDYGVGRGTTSKNNALSQIFGQEKPWKNTLLPHHKIDGFVSALKPEEWYTEWGNLWDPENSSRTNFELAYKNWKNAIKRHNEIQENLEKVNKEYKSLDEGRSFVEELEYDVQAYREISGEEFFGPSDFQIMSDTDYLKWCSEISITLNRIQKEMNQISDACQYYQEEFLQDYNLYVLENDNYNQIEEEKIKIDAELQRYENKKLLENRLNGNKELCRSLEQTLVEMTYLIQKGNKWYQKLEEYYREKRIDEESKLVIQRVQTKITDIIEEKQKLQVQLDERQKYYRDKSEYTLLMAHFSIISKCQKRNVELSNQLIELTNNYKNIKKLLNTCSDMSKQIHELYLGSFDFEWNEYKMQRLQYLLEDVPVEVSEDYFKIVIETFGKYDEVQLRIERLMEEIKRNEYMQTEIAKVLDVNRQIIKKHHLKKCPVCNSEFSSTAVLLEKTFNVASDNGLKAKEQLRLENEKSTLLVDKIETYIKKHNQEIEVIENKYKDLLTEYSNQIIKLNKDILLCQKEKEENEEQIQNIKKSDWEQGLYISYSEDGINKWFKDWADKLASEITVLEGRIKEKIKEIQDYQNYSKVIEKDIEVRTQNMHMLFQEIKEVFMKIHNLDDYVDVFSFEEIETEYTHKKEKFDLLCAEKESLYEELKAYEDMSNAEKRPLQRKQNSLSKQLNNSKKNRDILYKRMIKSLYCNKNEEMLEKQKIDIDDCKKQGMWLLNERERRRQMISYLEKMKFNQEVEKYFSKWKKLRNHIKETEAKEVEIRLLEEQTETTYLQEKQKIEIQMQEFLNQYQVNDIYEKLDPHEKMRTMICEFEFSAEEKPCLYFKTADDEGISYSPEWYFSTAQLNVVAFSLFLGRALMSKDLPIRSIFIDDPVGHFDEMNIVGFVDLLRNILDNTDRQLIISTHDERVYNLIRRKLPMEEYPTKYFDFKDTGKESKI